MESKRGGHRERLLAAGRMLFSQQGFAATSTREIAAQAGCNLALINHYFGSKEGLLVAILEAEMAEGAPDLLAVLRGPGSAADQLAGFIDRAIDHFAEDGEFLRIAHREVIQHGSRFLGKLLGPIEQMLDELADRFRKAGLPGGQARLDPRLTSLLLVGVMQFYFIAYPLTSRIVGAESEALKAQLKRHVRALFVDGLGAGSDRGTSSLGGSAARPQRPPRATGARRRTS